MYQSPQTKIDNCSSESENILTASQPNVLKRPMISNLPVTNMDTYKPAGNGISTDNHQTMTITHACRSCQRGYQQARDRLKRADRDLGETVGVVAASLTTATAVEAVINMAHDKIVLPREFLLTAFDGYIAIFALILVWGVIRSWTAIRKRTLAERDVDQAKKAIFQFCSEAHWPRTDE